jgi:hypothetical protein
MWNYDFETSVFKHARFKALEIIKTQQLNATNAIASPAVLPHSSDSSLEHETILYDTAAICAIVKNEDTYVDEWSRYHLSLEFNEIILYDKSENGTLKQWSSKPEGILVHIF